MLHWTVIIVVQLLSHVWLFSAPWIAACQASLSLLSLRGCSNSCPLSQWCHPTFSSSLTPFSSCPQTFSASGSFPMSQLFTSDGQRSEASAPASVLPMNIQGWFPLGLIGLISLLSKGLSRIFSSTTVQKHQFFGTQPSLWSKSYPYMTTGKTVALTTWTFVSKVRFLLFSMLSRFVIAFVPKSKQLLISWLLTLREVDYLGWTWSNPMSP